MLKLLLALIFLAGPKAHAVDRQDWNDCNSAEVERKVAACTRIAEDPRVWSETRAYVLSERARAREASREFDSAMADYAEAIRIAPRYAYSYYNRGRLY